MRNRIGTYYPPSKVLVDKNFLNTCPSRHISNGLGEIFKIALIKSKDLFSALDFYCETVGLQEKLCKGPLASKIINDKLYVAGGWDLRMLAKTPERDYWADRQVTCGDVWVTEIPY